MPPKKKVKVEVTAEDGEAEGGSKAEGGGEGGAGEAVPVASQQVVVGGPEAPSLELGSDVTVFEYAPGKELQGLEAGKLIRVEIESKYLTTDNEGVKQRRVWGSDPYTDNSDLVAMAMHSSVFTPTADPPKFAYLVMAVRVLAKHHSHLSSARNGIKTRAVSALEHSGLSIRVEGSAFCKTAEDNRKLSRVLLRPTRQERVSIKGNSALADARAVFNLSNEPAFKYSLAIVADRAPDAKCWTSVRFKTQTLYLETTNGKRYELSYDEEESATVPKYRFAEVAKPRVVDKKAMQAMGVPLPASECAAIVHRGLNWKDIEWGLTGLTVLGTAYAVKCCFWLPCSPKDMTA